MPAPSGVKVRRKFSYLEMIFGALTLKTLHSCNIYLLYDCGFYLEVILGDGCILLATAVVERWPLM